MSSSVAPQLSPSQRALSDLWDEHLRHEFATKDTDRTLETMVEDAYVNHVPVLTGGTGHAQLREFYSKHFISQMPPDLEIIPISRTIAEDRLVDEMVARFTHSVRMDWALPGIAPTGRRVLLPLIVVVQFRGGKLASERIYWDQASLLVQVGLLHTDGLPLVGVESGNKVLDPTLPSNTLIARLSK
ncbi:MAG: ester cyclase [Deltaproteobacteria bacterium]|nr:MAG: ester cyclase [Deltaproteobacteria bacterium]